jgi:hypothetical protein
LRNPQLVGTNSAGRPGVVYLTIIMGTVGLGVAAYEALENNPEHFSHEVFYACCGMLLFVIAVFML